MIGQVNELLQFFDKLELFQGLGFYMVNVLFNRTPSVFREGENEGGL